MSHFVKVCEFGKKHGTCRCPAENKTVIAVPCDRPAEHRPASAPPLVYEEVVDNVVNSDSVREAITDVIDRRFWYILPEIRQEFIEELIDAVNNA